LGNSIHFLIWCFHSGEPGDISFRPKAHENEDEDDEADEDDDNEENIACPSTPPSAVIPYE
jgi:hypothetical protein